jgi:hypothetical protein
MIDIKEIFDNDEVAKKISLWLGDDVDATELAGAAEYAVETNVGAVSVVPHDVKTVWPWLEKTKIKIMPRFVLNSAGGRSISDVAIDINSAFKNGANGAQIILQLNDLARFADSINAVRNDLFFNKDLSIGLDVFDVWPLDWGGVFDVLKKIHASSLLLIMSHEDNEKSDFTGRIYAALNSWDADKNMELHVMLGESFSRATQVYRLAMANKPELVDKLKLFVSY